MKYVLDASIALKWVLPEADTPQAVRLRNAYRQKLHELLAPDIFPAEVAHSLTRAERGAASLNPPMRHGACCWFSAPRPPCTRTCHSCAVPLTSPRPCASVSTTAYTSPSPSAKDANSSPPTQNWSPPWASPTRSSSRFPR